MRHTRTCVLLVVLCGCAGLSSQASAAASRSARPSTHIPLVQQLAVLDYEHPSYQSPRTTSALKAWIPAHRPITGIPTALPVLRQLTDRHGWRWLRVRLPGRPNSSTGWIRRSGTRPQSTGWNIQISIAARRVWVYYRSRLIRSFLAVVGKPSTPTPTGQFFVEEGVIIPAGGADGPYVLALSARSNVLQQFGGGPGQIGIHGRDGVGGTPGQAESHGCIRLTTPNIDWLAGRIGPGTPVTIR